MIQGFVKGQELTINSPLLVADTIDYLTAAIHFQTADWVDADVWAHFTQGDTHYEVQMLDDLITPSQHLNLSAGQWKVSLHGSWPDGRRVTTNTVALAVEPSGMVDGKPLPEVPAEPLEQVSATATAALTLAQDNKRRLDSGEGGGGGQPVPGGVTKEYVDAQDDEMLMDAMEYTDNQIKLVPTPDVNKAYVDQQDAVTAATVDSKLTGYLKTSDVSDWAKAPEKPSYTAEEVGALSDDTTIPTKTSELQNDSGFITQAVGYEEGVEPAAELRANVFHKFTAPAETITVTVTPSTGYAEYSFQFTTASGGGNLSIPAEFAWNAGKAPELKPNMTYQVVLFSGTAYISGGVPA